MQLQLAAVESQRQFPAFEHFAIAVLENWEQNPPFELRADRIPVDVEEIGERRRLSVLKHVAPPRVGRWIEPHMIGNEVEDEADPVLAEFRRQHIEVVVRPEFLVERVVVANVVTVRAASCRFQER